jgi:hypothetical protein
MAGVGGQLGGKLPDRSASVAEHRRLCQSVRAHRLFLMHGEKFSAEVKIRKDRP